MLRILARLSVVVCALVASQAFALGLGDINVKSKLNQPFSASIAVLGASSAQLDALTVKLAGPDEFNRAGIDRADYLLSLKFDVQAAGGGARVVISSDKIAREPFLNFIVEAHSPDGKMLREYTVLLDPPIVADSSAPAAQTASAPSVPADTYTPPAAPVVQVPAPSAPTMAPAEAAALAPQAPQAHHGKGRNRAPKPAAVAAAAAPAPVEAAPIAAPVADAAPAGGGSSYGPIAPQETFWSIATKLRPGPQVSMDQVLLAIYRANPQAFDRGSFNGLLKGQTLQVPSQAQMQETPAAQAKGAVDAWRHGTHPASLKKNPEASESAGVPAAPAPAAKPRPAKAKPAKAAAAEAKSELPAPVATPAPAPEQKPAAPTPQAAVPASTPAPAATAPAAESTTAPAPAKPQSADATAAPTPAPSSTQTAAATPTPADNAQAPAQPAEPPKKAAVPPPQSGLFDDPTTLLGAAIFVLVIGAFAWFIFRRRKDPTPDFRAKAPATGAPGLKTQAPAPPKKAGPPAPPPLPPKPQPSKLGDTTALPEQKPPVVAAPKPAQPIDFGKTQISEPPLSRTKLDDTAQVRMADTLLPVPSFEKAAGAKPAPIGGGDVDFDLTSQFEAQTLSVNLDANDPLSEADFHLAYGLYDEAASLLKQALVKDPQRQDLRLKLAETYFAGGKPVEFQETAESLHGQINPTEWQKIAIMGRQLCPDSSLFKSDGNAPAPDVDFSLGDSIGPAALQVLGTTPSRPAASQGNVIDFDLDHELNKATPVAPSAPAPAPARPAAAPAEAEKPDFDLSHFDFSAEPHPASHEGMVEFNLDELDLSKPGNDGHHSVSSGDEIGTKLDLARVYADMGDNDAARGLLNEVLNTGNIAQKGEAEALIKRLSA